MSDDEQLAALLEDAGWAELDRQHLEGNGGFYADTISGVVDGELDMRAFVHAIIKALREEEGE